MNPNSMEFVEDDRGSLYYMPTWPATEEEPTQRHYNFGNTSLDELQRQEQDAVNFLNAFYGDPPSRPICGYIKLYIDNHDWEGAWELWNDAEKHNPLLPNFQTKRDAMYVLGHGFEHFREQLPAIHGFLNGYAGSIYDHEKVLAAATARNIVPQQQEFIASKAAHRARDHQLRVERAKYEANTKALLEEAEQHSRNAARTRALLAERRERAPQKIGIQGSPKRVRVERDSREVLRAQRVPVPPPRFTPQAEVRRQHPHMQPRDDRGRFSKSDSDSKGKGEL